MAIKGKQKSVYRTCRCGHTWKTREDFLNDRNLKIVGYQPDFVNHRYNHFLFNHLEKGCGQFFGVRASDFSDLREKGCTAELRTGQKDCPGYCMNSTDLRVCSVACCNASDRKLAAKIRSRRVLRRLISGMVTSDDLGRAKTKPVSAS